MDTEEGVSFVVRGDIQPLEGRRRLMLREGIRDQARYIMFCEGREKKLQVADQEAQVIGDILETEAGKLRVIGVSDWGIGQRGRRGHREYILGLEVA